MEPEEQFWFSFITEILESYRKRNFMRSQLRQLRDFTNPFNLPAVHFRRMFRLSQEMVISLTDQLMPYVDEPLRADGISLQCKVLTALNFFGHGCYQKPIGYNFGIAVSQPSVSRSINQVAKLIATKLMVEWVKFPTTTDKKNECKEMFYGKHGCRGVLGVIDGTHVEIFPPPTTDATHQPHLYINRKGRHSVNVMLISDVNEIIMGCDARFPGSCHDSGIWHTSNIRSHLQEAFLNGDQYSHLIGDSGYPLEPWIFTPVSSPSNVAEQLYNKQHKSIRNVIERTNGVLKARFRCLLKDRVLHYHPRTVAYIVYACVVLHNMAIKAGLPLDDDVDEVIMQERTGDMNIQSSTPLDDSTRIRGQVARRNYIQDNF